MRCTTSAIALSGLVSGALAVFGSSKHQRQTRLFGNSFGIIAQNATYDYVVVGGGTAGNTIASRLAASPGVTVAIIEAGNFYEMDNGNVSQVPGYGSTYLTFDDLEPSPVLVDWGLITEPQEGLGGRRIHYTAGKTLGGSSALNDMIFHRGTKGSFKQWADLVGDDTFTWSNFLPYLKKSVAFTPPKKQQNIPYDRSAYTPKGGPLHASYPNYVNPFDSYMSEAFSICGLKEQSGLSSGQLDGFSPYTLALRPEDQTRSSSEASFLQQALDLTLPLTLHLGTQAKKILFDKQKKATGVAVEKNGAQYIISARKEVIVSAGVFHSPQLLMVSGVGPSRTLQQHGIPVVSNLKGVGQNMWDHLFIFTSHEMNLTTNSGMLSNPTLHAQAVEAYLDHQDGPLTGVGGGILAFEKLPNRTSLSPETRSALATFSDDWPELELLALAAGSNPANQPLANNFISITAALQTTLSRGYVTLRSADMVDPPVVQVNALSTVAEAELAVGAMKRMRELAAASGMLTKEILPGEDIVTDEALLEWVRGHAVNGYHASSTCSMGKASDPAAVVDNRGRVYGVKGLRVVDASAFPLLPPGHPMSTIYALAELVAEDVLES